MGYDCLIIDDERMLSENTVEYFEMFGVRTAWVVDAEACYAFFREHSADVILLDINLGGTSGFALCRHLRKTISAPILFISARTSDDDMVLALNIGGDDYIKKPYSLTVLLAKVKAVLKRYKGPGPEEDVFSDGVLRIHFGRKDVYVGERKLALKAMEYKLLAYLVKNKGRAIPKEELFSNVWGDAIVEDNTLNVHIRRLREKVEADPNAPRYIKTERGMGYIFEPGAGA
ncbi:MAG: response regulator transcription factor [Defluviitaleaceae bacterium]|nr:response regulator transcription factor [Defluviitaleaceae bacterium]MCL2240845.1 response regulator transcription factor [Defluviitaleaceae bacterium]